MRFPPHWVNAKQGNFSAWGWSDTSAAEAAAAAGARLQRILERFKREEEDKLGCYLYGDGVRPLREPVLEELPGAAITRNRYGCEVLNTTGMMFVDIDLPEPTQVGLLGRLFGQKPAPDGSEPALARVETWLARNRDWGFRVYRTRGGLRLLATHAPVDAAQDQSQLMGQLGADPLYVRLCAAQKSYRARLTPKPWRCDVRSPLETWPFADLKAESRFRAWQANYAEAARGYATCAFLRTMGAERTDPQLADLTRLHDERTRAASGLALA